MQSPKDLMQDIAANHFAQARAAAIQPQVVYLLLCNASPIGAYIHRSTAEYEMHICIQGDEDAAAKGKLGLRGNKTSGGKSLASII